MRSILLILALLVTSPALGRSPDPVQQRQPSYAALIRQGSHRVFRDLAGGPALTSRDVRRVLREQIGGKSGQQVVRYEDRQAGALVQHKVVQTGVDRRGRSKGYILSTSTDPVTKEQITQYHGTSTSWVRRGLGQNRVLLVLQKQSRRGRDGQIVMPAGTSTLQTREDLGSAMRISLHQDTLTGYSRQSTVTLRSDGRSERYSMNRHPTGQLQEERTRWDSKGRYKQLATMFDGQQVHVMEQSSTKQPRQRTLTGAQADRLFQRLGRGFDTSKQVLRRYRGQGWTWSERLPSRSNLGTIAARGRNGYLAHLKHGFVSLLGTRFGEVEQRQAQIKPSWKPGEKPVKQRTYLPQGGAQAPEPPPSDMSVVTLADRLRLSKATKLVNQAFPAGTRFTSTIDVGAGNTNAYVNPFDHQFQAHISPELARIGLPGLVGVLGHERKHDTETRWAHHEAHLGPMFRASQMATAGGLLEATVATLQVADQSRYKERRADRAAGQTLARVRTISGDVTMTPDEMLEKLKLPKGTPTPTAWTPVSQYDPLGQRRHTVGKAFGRELRRLQSSQTPK